MEAMALNILREALVLTFCLIVSVHTNSDSDTIPKTVTYLLSIYSATEMTKTIYKQVSKSQTIQLLTDAPWSTFSTHILFKISTTLKLAVIDISDYEIMCHIDPYRVQWQCTSGVCG
jgi:hypothetical protein